MRRRELMLAALAPLALAALFVPILASGNVVYGFDIVHEKLYWHHWIWETWGRGEIPTWNPHLACGAAFLPHANASPVYPLAAIHLLFSTNTALTLLVFGHLAWLGLGGFVLSRTLGGSPRAASLTSLALGLGGFAIARVFLGSMPQLFAFAWAPWIWAGIERGIATGRLRPYLAATAACGLSLLAGHPQMTAVGLLAAGLHLLVRLPDLDGGRARRRAIAGLTAVPIAAVLLAAAQTFPLIELFQTRGGTEAAPGQSVARLGALPLWQLPQLAMPTLFGDGLRTPYFGSFLHEMLVAHVGVLPLVLICALGRELFTAPRRGPAVVALVGVLLALDVTPMTWVRGLPPFDLFRMHGRWLGLTAMGAAVLAGFGLDAVLDARERQPSPTLPRGAWVPLMLGAVVLVAILAGGRDGPLWSRLYGQWAEDEPRFYVEEVFREAQVIEETYRHAVTAAASFTLLAALSVGLLALRSRLSVRSLGALLLLICGLDLGLQARPFVRPYTEADLWAPLPELLYETTDPEQPGRVATAMPLESLPLPGDLNRAYAWLNMVSQNAYHQSTVKGLESAQASLWTVDTRLRSLATGGGPFEHQFYTRRSILDLAGVQWVVLPRERDFEWAKARFWVPEESDVFDGLELAFEDEDLAIYRNPDALPRAFPVRDLVRATSDEQALERMTAPDFPVRTRAVVQGAAVLPPGRADVAEHVAFRRPTTREIELELSLPEAALVVIVEQYDPGWRAWLGKEPLAVVRTDAAFMGIVVPAGQHQIRMRHEPWYAVAGLTVSGLAWLGLVTATLFALRSRKPA